MSGDQIPGSDPRTLSYRITHFLAQLGFCLFVPIMLVPSLARLRITRWVVARFFGSAIAGNYKKIIDQYGDRYGAAMAQALERLEEVQDAPVESILDCGTGTGFVSRQAAAHFPDARIVATARCASPSSSTVPSRGSARATRR